MVPLMAAHNGGRLLRRRFLPVRNHPRLGATGVGRVVGARLLLARDAGLLRVCLLQAITSRDSPTRHQAWDCRSTTPWWDLRRIVICNIKLSLTLWRNARRAAAPRAWALAALPASATFLTTAWPGGRPRVQLQAGRAADKELSKSLTRGRWHIAPSPVWACDGRERVGESAAHHTAARRAGD